MKRKPRIMASFRLSGPAIKLLARAARRLGVSRTAVLELAIRRIAEEKEGAASDETRTRGS